MPQILYRIHVLIKTTRVSVNLTNRFSISLLILLLVYWSYFINGINGWVVTFLLLYLDMMNRDRFRYDTTFETFRKVKWDCSKPFNKQQAYHILRLLWDHNKIFKSFTSSCAKYLLHRGPRLFVSALSMQNDKNHLCEIPL